MDDENTILYYANGAIVKFNHVKNKVVCNKNNRFLNKAQGRAIKQANKQASKNNERRDGRTINQMRTRTLKQTN